jgi:hypothetical protein
MGDSRCAYWVVWENTSLLLEDLNVDGRIISKWILSEKNGRE